MSESKMTAEYNLHTNKLRVWPDTHLEREEWLRLKGVFGAWHRGSKCFAGAWSPAKEDEAIKLAGEVSTIIDDDAGYHYRLERFSGYEENAATRSTQAHRAADEIGERFAMGQPILIDHHSEKRARADQKRMHTLTRRAIWEADKAEYWQERQAAAERHAAYLEQPQVIWRRVRKLKSEIRVHQQNISPEKKAEQVLYYHDTFTEESWESSVHWHERWIEHLEMVLDYQETLYERSGGIPFDNGLVLEVGGAIISWRKVWLPIVRINKRNGEVTSVSVLDTHGSNYSEPTSAYNRSVKVDQIKHVLTAEEYAAHGDHWVGEALKAVLKAREDRTAGAVKGGAARQNYSMTGGSVGDWCHILRVNKKTVSVLRWYKSFDPSWETAKLDKYHMREADTLTPEEWQAYIAEHHDEAPEKWDALLQKVSK